MPCRSARPERGRTCNSYPGGSATVSPVGSAYAPPVPDDRFIDRRQQVHACRRRRWHRTGNGSPSACGKRRTRIGNRHQRIVAHREVAGKQNGCPNLGRGVAIDDGAPPCKPRRQPDTFGRDRDQGNGNGASGQTTCDACYRAAAVGLHCHRLPRWHTQSLAKRDHLCLGRRTPGFRRHLLAQYDRQFAPKLRRSKSTSSISFRARAIVSKDPQQSTARDQSLRNCLPSIEVAVKHHRNITLSR